MASSSPPASNGATEDASTAKLASPALGWLAKAKCSPDPVHLANSGSYASMNPNGP